MRRLRTGLRRSIALVLRATGLLELILWFRTRDRIVVLTYHRVLPEDADTFSAPGIIVTPQIFAEHAALLKRRFNVLTAAQLSDLISRREKPPSRACVVTFDDAWFDNWRYAMPVLLAQELPILLFVPTRFPDSNTCFWQETAGRQLFKLLRSKHSDSDVFRQLGLWEYRNADPKAQQDAVRRVIARLKTESEASLQAAIDSIQAATALMPTDTTAPGEDQFLGWEELRKMVATGLVAIGSHAASHRRLPTLNGAEVRDEFTESIRSIRREIGIEPRFLAYPNGDFDAVSVAEAARCGFVAAFTTRPGLVNRETHPYLLPRINIHTGSAATDSELLCRIAGIF